jgi:cyclic beta-1,2-glucan synthetase
MRSPEAVERYRAEPYAVAADVYAHPQHVGRGGWTWYTGSSGWMYQAAVQALLGLQRRGDTICFTPCVPAVWPGYQIDWTIDGTRYRIVVENPEHRSGGVASAELDGETVDASAVPLVRDGNQHELRIVLGEPVSSEIGAAPADRRMDHSSSAT